MVDGRRAQLLQQSEVRVVGVHQGRQVGGLLQIGRQGLVLSLERGVALRREVIVVEVVEIRLGLGGLFGAVLHQQRVGVVRLGHVDQGVVAAVQGVILADGGGLIHISKGQFIRRHVEHGHGVPAGLGEHVLQTAVRAGNGGGLMGGLGQGLRLGRVADEHGDARGALALTQIGGVSARHRGGELRLVAHLQFAGSAHVDQGDAVPIVFLVDSAAIAYDCGIITAGGLHLPHGGQDTEQTNIVPVVELHRLIRHFALGKNAVVVAVHQQQEIGAGVAEVHTAAQYPAIIVFVEGQARLCHQACQVGIARSQRQAAVGVQARAAEAGVQGGEVVQVRKGHRHVHAAGQCAIGVFQRFNMGDIMRPLSRVIVCRIAVEALEHFPVLGGAAHDAVSHVSL